MSAAVLELFEQRIRERFNDGVEYEPCCCESDCPHSKYAVMILREMKWKRNTITVVWNRAHPKQASLTAAPRCPPSDLGPPESAMLDATVQPLVRLHPPQMHPSPPSPSGSLPLLSALSRGAIPVLF